MQSAPQRPSDTAAKLVLHAVAAVLLQCSVYCPKCWRQYLSGRDFGGLALRLSSAAVSLRPACAWRSLVRQKRCHR